MTFTEYCFWGLVTLAVLSPFIASALASGLKKMFRS